MVTKRQLGLAVAGLGFLILLAIVSVDTLGAGRWGGFGPLQRIGIGLAVISAAVGLLLFRLGNRPA